MMNHAASASLQLLFALANPAAHQVYAWQYANQWLFVWSDLKLYPFFSDLNKTMGNEKKGTFARAATADGSPSICSFRTST